MTAFRAGGRRMATCSPLKPPQEMPIMPDRAAAPGLLDQPVDDFQRVVLFLLEVFVPHQAVGLAVAAHVHAHAGIAMAGHVGMGELVADRLCRRACGRAYIPARAGTGSLSASAGSQMRAARWQPSLRVIQAFSISFTWRGNFSTVFIETTAFFPFGPGRCRGVEAPAAGPYMALICIGRSASAQSEARDGRLPRRETTLG